MRRPSSATIFRSPEFIPINHLVTIHEDTLACITDERALLYKDLCERQERRVSPPSRLDRRPDRADIFTPLAAAVMSHA